MNESIAAADRLKTYSKRLRVLASKLEAEGGESLITRLSLLEQAAHIADQVEAKAEPGHGKKTAAEIGRRIRALMEAGR